MLIRVVSVILVTVPLVLSSGCHKSDLLTQGSQTNAQAIMSNYNAAIRSGVRGSSYPGQFNKLFPGAENVISYYTYTGIVGPPSWGSLIGLYGRYVLKLHSPIELDPARTKTNIISVGTPKFYLYELRKITPNPNPAGQASIQVHQIATLSTEEWGRLVDAKGDFTALGIAMEKNKPVEGFEPIWRKFWCL